MFFRRLSWAQLVRSGVPPLFVLRPAVGGCTPPNVGDAYPAPDSNNQVEMMRARQMYEQRRIGESPELERTLAQLSRMQPAQQGKDEASHKRGKAKARS
ncbi:MAG: hypothetical protein ABSH09_35000 [Bryobacteraceae bacterium]|jgi:hypothetical protein